MTDDPGVGEHLLDPAPGDRCHAARVEAVEPVPQSIALAQHGQPTEPSLKALEAHLLEPLNVTDRRSSPLLIVVGDVVIVARAPTAPRPPVNPGEQVVRRHPGEI